MYRSVVNCVLSSLIADPTLGNLCCQVINSSVSSILEAIFEFLIAIISITTYLDAFTKALWEYTESVDMASTAQLSFLKSSTLLQKGVMDSA